MKAIFAALCLMICQQAFPVALPSSASGMYVTPTRVVWLQLRRSGHIILLESRATTYETGAQFVVLNGLWAPEAGSCPVNWTWTLDPYPLLLREYARVTAVRKGQLEVLVGTNQTDVMQGRGGAIQTWYLVHPISSPAPYSCAFP